MECCVSPEGFVEKPFPSYLHYSFSSIYLGVGLHSLLSPSTVENDQYFNKVSFQYQACLFPLSTSRILAGISGTAPVSFFPSKTNKHTHTYTETQTQTHTHTCKHSSGHTCTHTHAYTPYHATQTHLPPQLTQLGQQTASHTLQITQLPCAGSSCPSEPRSFIMEPM